MPTTSYETAASTDEVWEVLSDGWKFPLWVVGASRIRAVDPGWPKEGSRIHHSIGLWPLLINDTTQSLDCHPGRELRLEARAMPFGKAEVIIRLHDLVRGCKIEIIEHLSTPPFTLVPRPAQRAAMHPRNVESLRRLALLAERSTGD
ncbi:SRPBCC family protein [Aldersonia kunmingensis]|uniref:SRPBCC family protein n=1 Tax=Aldersonia kunmingensis TaxID=408066 RepID=UPI00083059C9|nr:SRPBCC family protein [Aldersonia kunmingensis]